MPFEAALKLKFGPAIEVHYMKKNPGKFPQKLNFFSTEERKTWHLGWHGGSLFRKWTNAGYTPQDNRADFGPISSLPTILGNVPIILVILKIILSDFPVVWGVLRVTESARKNVGGAPIANCKYSTCWIWLLILIHCYKKKFWFIFQIKALLNFLLINKSTKL